MIRDNTGRSSGRMACTSVEILTLANFSLAKIMATLRMVSKWQKHTKI